MLNIVQMFFQVIKNTPLLHLKVLQPSFQTTNLQINGYRAIRHINESEGE
jgi:hypothetical protein